METARRIKRLRPQIAPWQLSRQRLNTLLDEARVFQFTFVTAPAGSGKTSLLSDWTSRQVTPVGWLSLDESDNQLEQFLGSLISTIQALAPGVGNKTLSILATGSTISPVFCAATLVDELTTLTEPIVLVLDDFHVLDDPDISTFMEAWLRLPAPGVHTIIASRTTISFPIATARSHGLVLEIDAAKLAFTLEEATAFLQRAAGTDVAPSDLAPFIDIADGWAAGLHVIALAVHRDPAIESYADVIDAARRNSQEFLISELLDRLPPEQQAFLCRIAVPDRISPDLAAALTVDLTTADSSDTQLADAMHAGFFLTPLGLEGQWLRFHSLFRGVLIDRLREILPAAEIDRLHVIASEWFLAAGDITAAIDHALRAGHVNRAVEIVSANAQLAITTDRWLEVEQWIEMLGPETVNNNLEIMVAHAVNLHARARYNQLLRAVDRIHQHMAGLGPNLDEDKRRLYLADLAVIVLWASTEESTIDLNIDRLQRAYAALDGSGRFTEVLAIISMASFHGMRDTDGSMAMIDRIIGESSRLDDPFSLLKTGWARCARSLVSWYRGNSHEMLDDARQALAIARRSHAQRLAAQCECFIGLALYELNDLAGAEAAFRSASTNPSCGAIFLTVATARHAVCLNAMGRETECDDLVNAYLDRLLDNEQHDNVHNFRATRARIAYSRGRFAEALSLIDSIDFSPAQADGRALEIPWLFKAILLLQRGTANDIAEADTLLDEVERSIGNLHILRLHLQLDIARAFQDQRHGRDANAAERIRTLLLDAERAGFARTILDLGPASSLLIGRYAAKTGYTQALLHELTRFTDPATTTPVSYGSAGTLPEPASELVYVEPLTDRELEILGGLYQRLSNKEIAYALSISPLTVKTHARNLYAKLGVNSRRQAIARALALGLLSPPDRAFAPPIPGNGLDTTSRW